MSKTRDARGHQDADTRSSSPGELAPPLKAQRGLFVLLALMLVGAFVAILALYFTTVYHR